MDTPVERKPGINRKHLYTIGGVALGIAVILYFIFRDTASSMTVEKDRLTIATVKQAEFNDYIRVIGQVMPNRIIYMDAIEGGRVEERLKEEGAMVKAGDVILRLSNPLLNIGIMQSEADLAYQENELRNTRISMEQERLQLKQERIGLNKELTLKKRRYEQYRRLVEEQLIAREDFRQAEEEYEAAKEQLAVIDERIRQGDTGLGVEDGRARIAEEVGGNDLLVGVAEDALELALAGLLHGRADLIVGGGLFKVDGQVDDGDIQRGNAHGHTGQLAVERGDDFADGLGGAGGGGDDIVENGAAGAPVAAAAGVDRLLLGGGGVDGGHERLLDAELVVDDLGKGR